MAPYLYVWVGEHSAIREAGRATPGGEGRKANVGMSNDNAGEKPARRKTKVSRATLIDPGLVGS
jgi:hypothetical protein